MRVEVYNRSNEPLIFVTNWHLPIQFTFLPVNRVSALLTFPNNRTNEIYTEFCGNGQCTVYRNAKQLTYCQCHPGWIGVNCTIPHHCRCSSDALCVGVIFNRSICLCPVNRSGSRCLLRSICETTNPCENGGLCTPHEIDPYRFTCRCPNQYSGVKCEEINNEIILSFNRIDIPQSMLIYFVTVRTCQNPRFTVLSTRIPYDEDEIILYFPHPFHIVVSHFHSDYYLIVLQENSTDSISMKSEISPSTTLSIEWPLLRRIKSVEIK